LYQEVRELICGIASKFKIIGMDIVEMNPLYDFSQISALHCDKIILDLMASIYENE
jgi:arginase family enzyme